MVADGVADRSRHRGGPGRGAGRGRRGDRVRRGQPAARPGRAPRQRLHRDAADERSPAHLPQGVQRGPAPDHGGRPRRVRRRRGRGPDRRRVPQLRRPRRPVRRAAHGRHPDRRTGDHRAGHRRRRRRAPADRRSDVHGLRARLHGPDRQPGGQAEVHVRRQRDAAADHHHQRRRRPLGRGPAQPEPRSDVVPRARPQGGHALDAVRPEGPAGRLRPRRQPDDRREAQEDAGHEGRRARRALRDPPRHARTSPAPGPT